MDAGSGGVRIGIIGFLTLSLFIAGRRRASGKKLKRLTKEGFRFLLLLMGKMTEKALA